MRRLDCHDRLKQVKGNYQTALRTVQAFIALAKQQPQYLYDHHLTLRDVQLIDAELHDIYFARLFACFESSIRHYWRTKIRDSEPPTAKLLSSVAGRRGVPQDVPDAVNEVREFRNYLIHEEHEAKRRITIEEAAKHLNSYLARLPLKW